MEVTFHEQDGVIIRRFTGEVCFADMIESWKQLLLYYKNLQDYKGILTTYLDADIKDEHANLNVVVEYLMNYVDRLKNLKIAVVENTPLVTNTIIVSQRVKSLQIKPFSTMEAAMNWITD